MAICSIPLHLIRNIRVEFGIPNSPKSPDIAQNSDWGISGSGFMVKLLQNKIVIISE